MTNYVRSDVYLEQSRVSSILQSASTTTTAVVIEAERGQLGPQLITSAESLKQYGKKSISRGFGLYAADFYLKAGNQIWVNRVVGSNATYGGVLLQNFGTTGARTLQFVNHNSSYPEGINFLTAGAANDLEDNLLYMWSIGPGSKYKTSVEIASLNMAVPTGLAGVASAGGTLAAGSYLYRVSAFNKLGQTLAATQISVTATVNQKITLSWNTVAGADGYIVYGRTGTITKLASVANSSAPSFVDDGSLIPVVGVVVPTVSYTPSSVFVLNVYDSDISATFPVEAFEVTLSKQTSGFGSQTEISEVVNANSQYLRVLSNIPNILSANYVVPDITPIAKFAVPAGADGSAITASNVIAGYNVFSDTELYPIRVILGAGYTDASVQNAISSLIRQRNNDCIGILDVPRNNKEAIGAVDYRVNTINIDNNNCALFVNWQKDLDIDNNSFEYFPPSCYVGQLLAYTDRVSGAGSSPAGLNRGIIGAIESDKLYNEADRNTLISSQINYFHKLQGSAIALWEQRTLSKNFTPLSFLNIVRIRIVIDQTIKAGMFFALQEPNNDFVEAEIRQTISDYLQSLKTNGEIEDFWVITDSQNNSSYTKSLGQRIVDYIIKPSFPIEKLVIRSTVTANDINVDSFFQNR
jgi:hypothetical protein